MKNNLFITFVYLFYLLFFSFICGILCGKVCAAGKVAPLPAAPENTVKLFKKEDNCKVMNSDGNGGETDIKIDDYYSPFLLFTNDIFISLIGVNSTCDDDKKITVLTKYIVTKDESENEWWKKIFVESAGSCTGSDSSSSSGSLKIQLTVQKEIQNADETIVVKSFIAVAKAEKIYLLLINCNSKTGDDGKTNCHFYRAVGTITGENKEDKKISWTNPEIMPNSEKELSSKLKKVSQCKYPSFGNAFFSDNEENIIFVVKAKTTDNENITLLVQSKINNDKLEDISVKDITEKCHPYIFPWNKAIIKLSTPCNNEDTITIKKSTNIEKEWNDIEEPISRLANFFKDKKYFISADIDEKELIIFTHEIKTQKTPISEKRYLWISNGTRAKQVGEITINSDCIAPTGIFYVNNELFLFTQNSKTEKIENVCLTRLEKNMEEIKKVITAWKSNEKKIEDLCTNNAYKNIKCSTAGLVGYLSNTLIEDNSKWEDKYLYSNPTLKGEKTTTTDSIIFKGNNAGAQWDVTEKKEERPYKFDDSGFTLLVTATVQQITEGKYNSILGINFEDGNTVSLLCNNEGRWVVGRGKELKNLELISEDCKNDNTYQIALIFKQPTEFAVYIDGKKINDLSKEIVQITKAKSILRFYFGVDKEQNNVETHVTIKNVLLYNRPFGSSDIAEIKVDKQKDQITDVKEENSKTTIAVQHDGGDSLEMTEETVTGGGGDDLTLATPTEEVMTSSTQQRESAVSNSVNINVNVVMCSILFILFNFGSV